MKKLLVVLGVIVGSVLIVSLFVVSKLPSRSEIAQSLNDDKNASSPKTPQSESATSTESQIDPRKTSTRPQESISAESKREDRAIEMRRLIAIMEEDPRDIRVCDQLGKTTVDLKKPMMSFGDLFSEDRSDSIKEAFRMPLRAVFQEPAISELMHDLQEMEPVLSGKVGAEKEGFLSKVGFYTRVAKASATLYSNKRRYERLGDRAVHLSMLSKLAVLKPELQNSAQVADFCRKVQGADLDPDQETIVSERNQLLELIRTSGMTPEKLDFDPTSWIRFNVKSDKNQLSFSLADKDPPAGN